jgi:hypothetical protein
MLVSPTESAVSPSFAQAFERLLTRAPGPVFPRARSLYLCKYPLEADGEGAFRTFLLQEELLESAAGAVRSRALAFAVVHWQAAQVERAVYAAYLAERWQIHPHDLSPVQDQAWFREGGAWARFSLPVVYEGGRPTTLLSPTGDPDAPGAPADPGR